MLDELEDENTCPDAPKGTASSIWGDNNVVRQCIHCTAISKDFD